MIKKAPLGKGLGALFPEINHVSPSSGQYKYCGIEELIPNRFQPRRDFADDEQRELVASVRERGIIQPIIVRRTDGGYEIIAGERRWRAAQQAGLPEVPIVVRDADDREVAEISLIENLQRADLNPIEEAQAFQTLTEQFGLHQEEIAARLGKDRSTITNALRLLHLPQTIQEALIHKTITAGHARALLSLSSPDEQLRIFNDIVAKGMSVRATEAIVRKVLTGRVTRTKSSAKKTSHPQLVAYEREVSSFLQTKVRIKTGAKGGAIEIRFSSPEELERILSAILQQHE